MKAKILVGDVLSRLRELPDESVQCVVTSPPYWGLRDYGCAGQLGLEKTPEKYVAGGGGIFREGKRVLRDYGCAGQLGLEKTPEKYVAGMVDIFREVKRVLRKDGTVWLNLGDSY